MTALVSIALTVYTQRKTAEDNRARDAEVASMNVELATLSATLDQQRDEATARRDYTYEALKRLYNLTFITGAGSRRAQGADLQV